MSERKDCAFQFIVQYSYGAFENYEDTGLITLDDAKKLWEKWLPTFIRHLQGADSPEMGIWIGMKDETDYRESIGHLDSRCKVVNSRVYRVTETLMKADTPS